MHHRQAARIPIHVSTLALELAPLSRRGWGKDKVGKEDNCRSSKHSQIIFFDDVLVEEAWHSLVHDPAGYHPGQTPCWGTHITGKHSSSEFPLSSTKWISKERGKEAYQGLLQILFLRKSTFSFTHRGIPQRSADIIELFFLPIDHKPGKLPAVSLCF